MINLLYIGFLSTEDDVIPGNFGLKDQAAVLLWIKNYIGEFGGDLNRVTLSGESSSSLDVVLHMMSPLSKSKSLHLSYLTELIRIGI